MYLPTGYKKEKYSMKKLPLFIVMMLIFSLLLCSAAFADTITALAIEVNPEHLEKTASYARILGCNQENSTLTVELIAQEVFSGEDVLSLKPGDSIYTGGREVTIESMAYDDDWCSTVFINDGELMLFQDRSGNYTMMADEDDYVWNAVAQIQCPVRPSLLFLDSVDHETGEPLSLPVVRTADELMEELRAAGPAEAYTVGLATNNVYVIFDGEGNLAAIHRYYVPWQ